jgi:hypothetical protein
MELLGQKLADLNTARNQLAASFGTYTAAIAGWGK